MRFLAHRQVWRLATPLILSNITVALLGVVDTAVVGHLDDPVYLGGVAIGGTLFSVLFWGFGFLRMGTSGVTAQQYGRADNAGVRATLVQSGALAMGLGAMLVLLQQPVGHIAFEIIGASAEVTAQAQHYYAIRIWSAPAAFLGYALLGWFLGLHNGRAQLYLLTWVNGVNILLDLLFVVVLDWRVAGVAWASVLAEYSGVALAGLLAARTLQRHPGPWLRERVFDAHALRRMMTLNRDIFLRTLCLVFAFAFFNAQSARLGDQVLAANAILLNFLLLTSHALDGVAFAGEALVGRAVGRRDRTELRAAIHSIGFWSLVLAAGFTLVFALFGMSLVRLMTALPEVIETAARYLPWAAALPLIAVWGFFLDGVFVGATRAREMRDTMIISVLAVYLPLWWLTRGYGNHGLWLAFSAYFGARGASMAVVLMRLWRRRALIAASVAPRQAA